MRCEVGRLCTAGEIYNKLFNKNWVVYAKQQFHTPKYVMEYLGRYTHKIAISNYLIKQLDRADRTVTFQLKNYKKGGQKELLADRGAEALCLKVNAKPKRDRTVRQTGAKVGSGSLEKC
jgi:hypothetical protein